MLAIHEAGEGLPVVLLHGLTATHRYVVMGSRALERSGHRVIAYDARGHGDSDPAPDPAAYRYEDLVADLLAVLDERGVDRPVLAGASMGAHTLLRFALEHPDRVLALVAVTPAYEPASAGDPEALARWDALSDGLREGGVEGFLRAQAAGGGPQVAERHRATVETVQRQRLALHRHPDAVADALRAVPRSRPFASLDDLGAIAAPTLVVGDRDEADPTHPLETARAYAAAIPGARLLVEEPGESPIAWQGGRLSRAIAELAAEAAA